MRLDCGADIRSSAPKIESWDVGMWFASDSRPGSEPNSRGFHRELDTGHGQGLVGCWTSLHDARFLLDVGSHAMSASCQVLDISGVVPGSCWMLGLMRCHWLLLDLGYLVCGVRFLLDLGYLARGVIFLLGRGRLARRQVLVGCWVPYDVTGSC